MTEDEDKYFKLGLYVAFGIFVFSVGLTYFITNLTQQMAG